MQFIVNFIIGFLIVFIPAFIYYMYEDYKLKKKSKESDRQWRECFKQLYPFEKYKDPFPSGPEDIKNMNAIGCYKKNCTHCEHYSLAWKSKNFEFTIPGDKMYCTIDGEGLYMPLFMNAAKCPNFEQIEYNINNTKRKKEK